MDANIAWLGFWLFLSVFIACDALTDHEKLQAECEKLRKDAERYRWLREYFCSTREDLDDLLVEACGGNDPSKLDEVIDTTMQGDQP